MKRYTKEEMLDYGYTYQGMEPVDREMAMLHFIRNDYEVYRLYSNDTEGLVEDVDEFLYHNDMYGIEKVSHGE